MIALRNLSRAALAVSAWTMLPTIVHAEGLQVAPVSVTIPERSGVVWLNNEGDQPLRAQVRVFRWTQADGEDVLAETTDVVASPPFAEIAPGTQQVIRLVRFGTGATAMTGCEQTYRIIVDELPPAEEPATTGLQYVLRYSVPVYLTNPACRAEAPALTWRVEPADGGTMLVVSNAGQFHAQLANIGVVDAAGLRTEISGGLLGYVLPGAERRFAIPVAPEAFTAGGNLEVKVNGEQVIAPVLLAQPGQ
ncbi:MAG: molecular chaperone [Alteraurantiacibacter sp.]